MNLYLLTQDENDGYDTYDSCIVAADTPEDAVLINPRNEVFGSAKGNPRANDWAQGCGVGNYYWARTPAEVTVRLIGEAAPDVKGGVVLSSFNAG